MIQTVQLVDQFAQVLMQSTCRLALSGCTHSPEPALQPQQVSGEEEDDPH